MKFDSLFFFISLNLITINCYAEEQFPPEGKTIPEMVELQNHITKKIKQLDADKWEDRKQAKKELLELIDKSKYVFQYFLKNTFNHKSPEIKLSSKEILKEYFLTNIYDPDRKKGFIGISMAPGGAMTVEKKRYIPITVMATIPDFPAEKVGIKANDKILKVDENICSEKFDLDSFTTYIAAKKPGDKVNLKLLSGGKVVTKNIILGERPKDQPSSIPVKSVKQLFDEWYKLKLQEILK